MVYKSPLRYPGGKSRAAKYIFDLIPKGTTELVSPFFGGGSVELLCASHGITVHGYDLFRPLVEFWQCLLSDKAELAELVNRHHPISKEDFYALQKSQHTLGSKLERAAAFYVLNRASFSGSTLSGGMSPNHPRFTESSIQRLRDFAAENFSVDEKDFSSSITDHSGSTFYLDPPYLIKNNLYGKKGDTHKHFKHDKLREILEPEPNWILSYNNCEEIRSMYEGFTFLYPSWKYGMSNDKESKEILILSKNVAELNNL